METPPRAAAPSLVTRRLALLSGLVAPLAFSRAARADDADAVRARGVLRLGTSGDYAPFSSVKGQGFAGLDIELASRLAKDLGVRSEFVPFTWPELSQQLRNGDFDLAVSGITQRGERALVGHLSRPYAVTSAVAVIRSADRARFSEFSALNHTGIRLSVNAGGYLEGVARRLFPLATIETTHDNTQLFAPVLAKTADAAISDSAEAHVHRSAALSTLGAMTHDRKALFVAAGAPHLADWIDVWLRARERDGFLPTLRQRHLGASAPGQIPLSIEAALGAIQQRCELMPFVGAYKVARGLPIEDAAQEARVLARMADAARGVGLEAEGVQSLYQALMAAAKEIELNRGSEPNRAQPTLDELRDVIRGLDAQLLAELRDNLQRHVRADWPASVERGLSVPGLSSDRKAEIGAALARVQTLGKR